MVVRRVRGALLRFVRRRALAIAVGSMLVVPALWIELGAGADSPWLEGLALVVGATGAAILWTGLAGIRPDWIDEPEVPRSHDGQSREV